MNAAEALDLARAAGVRVEVDGEDLILEAPAAPPPPVVDLLSRHKRDVVDLLRHREWEAEDWQAFFDERAGIAEFDSGLEPAEAEATAFEECISEWIMRRPARSSPDSCIWCGGRAGRAATIVPFGRKPERRGWLHGRCWPDWHNAARVDAAIALRAFGVLPGHPRRPESRERSP